MLSIFIHKGAGVSHVPEHIQNLGGVCLERWTQIEFQVAPVERSQIKAVHRAQAMIVQRWDIASMLGTTRHV